MADKKPKKLADLRDQKQDLQSQDVSGLTNAAFAKRIKEEKQINDLIDQRVKKNKAVIKDAEEYLDTLESIGGQVGKNSKLYQEFEKKQGDVKNTLSGITTILSKTNTLTKEQVDDAEEAAAAYKKGTLNIQSAFAALVKNKDANIDIEKVVESQIKSQKAFADTIKDTTGDAAELKKVFDSNVDTLEKMKEAMKAAAKDMKAMNKVGEMLNNTPFGGMINQGLGITKSMGITKQGNLGDVTSNLVAKRGAGAAAGGGGGLMSAVGGIARLAGPAALIGAAAYGIFKWYDGGGPQKLAAGLKMLGGDTMMDEKSINDKAASLEGTEEFRKINAKYNYIKPLEERQTREKEYFDWQKSNTVQMVDYGNQLVKDELNFQIGLKKDAINFGFQQAMQTMEAEAARRKSLFLTGMAMYKKSLIVSERALQAIGSSTEAVFESIKDIGLALGVSLSEQIKMATSAAGLAKLYGSSGEDVLKMSKNFRLMDKSSAKVAFNNVAGVAEFAKMNDMSPAQLFKQMADASEEVMKYSNMTTSQYASQAVLLSNMNTSMKDMATASGTMVLNYKDSIKSEMSLSAMLGKNVNLSEVRARLMSGDMAGGATALKSALGGMDIGSMNAFQKQELSKATGMGVEQLMELTQSKGGDVKGTLAEKAGLKTGADIAKGALDMDVSLAGQRLGMEQAQRAEMLKFEQRERLIMMQLEQAQKLKMLEVEAYFRVKFTKEMEQSHEKQMAAAKHLEEMGSGYMMGGGKNLTDQAFKGLEGTVAATKGQELQTLIGNMVKEKRVDSSDMRLAQYYTKQFDLTDTLKDHPKELAEELEKTYKSIFQKETFNRDLDVRAAQIQAKIDEKQAVANQWKGAREGFWGYVTEWTTDIEQDQAKAEAEISELIKQKNAVYTNAGAPPPTSQGPLFNPANLFGQSPNFGFQPNLLTPNTFTSGTPTIAPPPPVPVPVPPPAAATNFGDIGKILERIAFSSNELVKNGNKLFDTTNKAIINGNTIIGQIDKVVTWIDTSHQNNFVKMNSELGQIKTINTNGYTEILKRADATNQLLDTLIGATADAAAKPIQISGKRINDVMTTVKTRTYALTGA